jgi:hypothetical protein
MVTFASIVGYFLILEYSDKRIDVKNLPSDHLPVSGVATPKPKRRRHGRSIQMPEMRKDILIAKRNERTCKGLSGVEKIGCNRPAALT